MLGLARESLIGSNWGIGNPSVLQSIGYGGTENGMVVDPSAFGVELFLYAMGGGHFPINIFLLLQETTFDSLEGVTIPTGCHALIKGGGSSPNRRFAAGCSIFGAESVALILQSLKNFATAVPNYFSRFIIPNRKLRMTSRAGKN
jgi:hypothetical protein